MKIEIIKYHKTREGNKVRIYCVDAGGVFCVHGAILLEQWRPCSWTASGKVLISEDLYGSDIISEWIEPKPRLLAWRGPDGSVVLTPEGKETVYQKELSIRVPYLDEPEDSK